MRNTQEVRHPYWGFWATIGFGVLIFITFSLIQSVILIGYGVYLQDWTLNSDFASSLNTLVFNGDAIGIAEIPSALIGTALILVFASIPKVISIKDYLKIYFPPFLTIIKWLGVMVLLILIMEGSNILLEREVPDFMSKVYGNTDNFIILWIAVIIGAPIFEEFLFRGFIFEGLKQSAVGLVGATLITASSWAIIHLQYGWYEIITIFLIGIVFAIAKHKTQSLYIPIFMHMLMNLTASVLMELS